MSCSLAHTEYLRGHDSVTKYTPDIGKKWKTSAKYDRLLDIAHKRTRNTVPRSKRKALAETKTVEEMEWKRKKNSSKGVSEYTDII